MAKQPEWLIELGIKVYGLKNLKALDLYSQRFIVRALMEVRRRIQDSTRAGRNEQGEPLQPYSKAYAKRKARLLRHTRVDMRWTGRMMDSLEINILKKGIGRLYFRGHHAQDEVTKDYLDRIRDQMKETSDPELLARLSASMRQALSFGSQDLKRNQDLADRLAHRKGKGQWLYSTEGRPPNEFMMVGSRTKMDIMRLYDRMVIGKALVALPMSPPVDLERWRKL